MMYCKLACGLMLAMVFTAGVSPSQGASSAVVQFAEFHDLISGLELPGGGILTRKKHAVQLQLAISDLDRDAAYSA